MMTFAFAAMILLLLIWRIKKGFANGMMQEIVNLLSGLISLACVALVFIAVTSAMNQSTHILTACIIALILLGILFKLCRLLFMRLLAVGAAEACLLAYFSYKALAHFGIYVF